jgi:hypothetical protein
VLAGCSDSPAAPDAEVDAPPPRCNPSLPFGSPVLVDSLNSRFEDVSARLAGFGPAAPLDTLNQTELHDIPTWISPDRCHLYYYSNAPVAGGGMDMNIYMASRPL